MKTLADILPEFAGPVAKDVSIRGQTIRVHVKPITAGERAQLLAGQKFSAGPGGGTMEVDLSQNETTKHKMVFFAICNEDGSRYFDSAAAVGKQPGLVIDALYKAASEVNAEPTPEETGND